MTLASLILILASPLLLLTAIVIHRASPGPCLFRQTRVGIYGQPFTMLKLRTMHAGCADDAHRLANRRELTGCAKPPDGGIFKLENDPRIVQGLHWVRRYSIDELPQLVNVLRGEMSLVGPRPSLPWEAELYTPEQRRRVECLPGMTGLWQVSGRNRLSMVEMLALDLRYVEQRSLLLDLWILWRTPFEILSGDNTR
jgi:lipopolysaccharide/colanic/teichoic acid biosynthesis glycosyltransferase